MGVLADIYISRNDEARGYDKTPDRFANRAQYKGFTPLELSTLWSLMRGTEWDIALMEEFPCLLQVDGGERLIHGLPATMISDLSRLTPEQIATLSPKWAGTEELCWSPDDAREVIESLVRLARDATESGRGLYLWNCV
jgi:hypothetical protein